MADKNYTIPENPAYRVQEIRQLQDTDPASATETFNPLIQQLLESIAYVDLHKAGLDETGKVPEALLPPSGGHIAQAGPPENHNLLWVDTAGGNVLKFYDPASQAWKPVGAVWS